MKLSKIFKRKKPSKPPLQPPFPGKPADVPVRPPGFQSELDAGSDGGCGRYQSTPRSSDLTVTLDERSDISPRMSVQVRKDEDEEHPLLETSTSGPAIRVTGDEPKGECF